MIDEVAYDIVELLRELKNQPPQTDSPAPASTSTAGVKPHVLLAAEGNIEAARLVAIDAMDDVKRPAAGELSSAVGATVALQEPARTLVGTYGWPTQGRRSEGEGWRLPIEFDPNGRFVAVAGPSREPGVHLWDTKTGSAIRAFAGLHAQIRSLALSPDGTIVVAGSSDGEAVAWQNTDAAPVIGRVQLSTGAITALTFSPDGQAVLIGSEDSDVPSVWRLPTAWQDAMAEPCQSSAVPAHKYAGKGPKRGQ